MSLFAVIIPAAGQSSRFGGNQSKLLELLGGRAVISYTVTAFLCRRDVSAVILPTRDVQAIRVALEDKNGRLDDRLRFCEGGGNRAESVQRGLALVDEGTEWVAVHDAARPLVYQQQIDRTWAAAVQYGAAAPALPVQLTIKQATGPLPAPVEQTIARNTLWAMQTPQIMRADALRDAIQRCPIPLEQVTDDVQFLELIGQEVWLVPGEERNTKITTRMDLRIAEECLHDSTT
jgi:2-C-methyl-D-erythritol 4-phosphate cytidylyltransferase